MMVLTRFWRSLTKKDVLRVLDMNYKLKNNNFYRYPSFRAFIHGPGFSGSDPDFWPIRIRTQKIKSDPNPGKKTRTRNTG